MLVAQARTIQVLGWMPFDCVNFGLLRALDLPPWTWYLGLFYSVNYFLLAFNLLPIYPMDGGQLFQCLLWPFLGLHRAMTIACQVGLIGCIGLGLWGISSGGGGMLLFIAMFGGFTCSAAVADAEVRDGGGLRACGMPRTASIVRHAAGAGSSRGSSS